MYTFQKQGSTSKVYYYRYIYDYLLLYFCDINTMKGTNPRGRSRIRFRGPQEIFVCLSWLCSGVMQMKWTLIDWGPGPALEPWKHVFHC